MFQTTESLKLAILGGGPAFADVLHVGRPNVGDRTRLLDRINAMLDRNWLTNDGPLVQEFEAQLTDFLKVKHCVAVCNATLGLELAIRAAGLTGEVIMPSFTFIATAHALEWQGITPVFCDIDPATHNIDPAQIERLITPRTTGIIGVHVWGRACDTEALAQVAERHGLKLLFDAAHAFGCSHRQQMIGNFGLAEVFSFHATKFFNTLEGGAITTNDGELAEKLRLMRNFGFAGMDNVVYIGTNGKMNEVSAAMGLTSLESVDDFIAVNRRNYLAYREAFQDVPGCDVINYDEAERNNFQYVIVEIDGEEAGLTRDEIVKVLHAENVRARRYFYPGCHQMEPYRSYYPNAGLLLAQTERLAERVTSLPTGQAVGKSEIQIIGEIVRTAMEFAPDVRTHLRKNAPKTD